MEEYVDHPAVTPLLLPSVNPLTAELRMATKRRELLKASEGGLCRIWSKLRTQSAVPTLVVSVAIKPKDVAQ